MIAITLEISTQITMATWTQSQNGDTGGRDPI